MTRPPVPSALLARHKAEISPLAKREWFCHLSFMFHKSISTLIVVLCMVTLQARAQNQTQTQTPAADGSTTNSKTQDTPQPNRFWQASLGGGDYMVALDRISAISRHKYLLDGGIVVDEVTVDALGQALVRFYFLAPLTDVTKGSHAGTTASGIVDRARELVDKAADNAGTDAHNMVIKKFPETTHAHEIEYRVDSADILTALYTSVQTAWVSGHGRKYSVK